jgi:hypothetical protein
MKHKYAFALGLSVLLSASPAAAAPWDYTFQLLQPPTVVEGRTVALVRVVHVSTGRAVTGAEVSVRRFVDAPYKSTPRHIEQTRKLRGDASGVFQYVENGILNRTKSVWLIARVPGEFWTIQGGLQLPPAR